LTLLAIVLFAAPLVKSVPLSALAAILMIVAYNMGDWKKSRDSKAQFSGHRVWLLTLTLTVVTDLTFAVEVGMVLAALTFIRKVSRTTTVSPVTKDYVEDSRVHVLQGKDIPTTRLFTAFTVRSFLARPTSSRTFFARSTLCRP